MNFLKLTRRSVFQFVVMALVAFGFFAVLPLQAAQAQQTITVPCSGEIETPEGGLRATSDGNTWEFAIVPGEHTQIYHQQWFFNGLSPNHPNAEQGWGQFGGGDGANAFSWVSPTQGGSYSIKVKAKRRCTLPGGGNGPAANPNFEIEWGVDVQASKAWSTGTAMTATMAAPAANASVAPGVPVTVSVAASDSDHWIKGVEAGDEADDLIYTWSASGGFISGSGSSVSWTPPNATGVYTITCEVNDAPKEITSVDTGTRDDEPKITVTATLAVPPRTWSAGAGIGSVLDDRGKPVLKDGVALQNGRLVSPSNQTVPKPVGQENYPTIKVRPGKELRCTVESASDWDHWMRAGVGAETDDNHGTVDGDEEDEVKYTWSAGVGGFKDGKNTGTSVTWIAPKVGDAGFNPANEYTVTCAIDDTPKVVIAPDVPLGNTARDDASIERNFKVKVVDDTSWMELGLYKDQSANPQPALAIIGGEIYIAVDVQIGGDTKITAPGAIYLRLSEHDGMNLHNAADNHAYVLVSQTGWNEWNFAGNSWGTDPISMPNSNTTNTPRRFRKWIAWNTTAPIDNGIDPDGDGVLLQAGKLWGHNASHTVELEYVADNAIKHEMEFRPNDDVDPARKSGPNLIGAEVGNLVITNVTTNAGNPDYFKFDAESSDLGFTNPTITFTVEDKGDPHHYQWWVWVKPSRGEANSVELTGVMAASGTKTVTINQPQAPDTQDHDVTEWGTYTFDIRVREVRNDQVVGVGEPLVDYRSQKLFVPPFYSDNGAQKPGHDFEVVVDEAQGEEKAEISYYLEDSQGAPLSSTRNATSVQVEFLDPVQKVLIKKDLQKQVRVPREGIELYTFNGSEGVSETQPDGTFRAIFTAVDGHRAEYRDHQSKRMKPVNKGIKIEHYFHIEDDHMVSPNGALFPQARSKEIKEAFNKAGWEPLNAKSSPKQVLLAACTVVDYKDILGVNAQGINERIEYSKDNFHYYNARNTPAYVTQYKWGRYVHVIGAHWEKTPPTNINEGREMGSTDDKERFSIIYITELLAKKEGHRGVVLTTVHEVGHQFQQGHQHGEWASDKEKVAYESGDIATLRKYRGRPTLTVGDTGKDDFRLCIMEPGYDPRMEHYFCKFHEDRIRGYKGW